jgi:hypothetical protein
MGDLSYVLVQTLDLMLAFKLLRPDFPRQVSKRALVMIRAKNVA